MKYTQACTHTKMKYTQRFKVHSDEVHPNMQVEACTHTKMKYTQRIKLPSDEVNPRKKR